MATTKNVQRLENFSEVYDDEHEIKPQIGTTAAAAAAVAVHSTSESVPRLHTESSLSEEHVVSPDVTCEKEVQSEPKWNELGLGVGYDVFDFQLNYLDSNMNISNNNNNLAGEIDPFAPQFQYQMSHMSPLQDMFMYPHKPF